MNILITGGTGYIGSHTIVELLANGHSVVALDNLVNSSDESLKRVEKITGKQVSFYKVDLLDKTAVTKIFADNTIDAVIHFAGLKAVGESVTQPIRYYENNITGTLNLLEAMAEQGVKKLVFSSSATVYGSAPVPYTESSPIGRDISSPYGKTKFMIEEILRDAATANPELEFTSLRYFNPIGAHPSGLIGEDPHGPPNNIMPFITQVATGRREKLSIFGDDYNTPDGTCQRDYIHVVDLARGHLAALEHTKSGYSAYNLGSGQGVSVLELVSTFEKASDKQIPYEIAPRRSGDLPAFWADASLALKELNWQTKLSLEDACRDSWNWQSQNPDGYSD